MAGGDRAAGDRGADEVAGGMLGDQVDRRRRAGLAPSRPWISRSQSDWPRWPRRSPIATITSPAPLKRDADRLSPVLDQADAADRGGGQDGAAAAVSALLSL